MTVDLHPRRGRICWVLRRCGHQVCDHLRPSVLLASSACRSPPVWSLAHSGSGAPVFVNLTLSLLRKVVCEIKEYIPLSTSVPATDIVQSPGHRQSLLSTSGFCGWLGMLNLAPLFRKPMPTGSSVSGSGGGVFKNQFHCPLGSKTLCWTKAYSSTGGLFPAFYRGTGRGCRCLADVSPYSAPSPPGLR